MDMFYMSKKKKVAVVSLFILPLLISLILMTGLKASWTVEDSETGERFSPIENRPLFIGLMIFTLGYLFFLGMLFSENIIRLFNREYHRY